MESISITPEQLEAARHALEILTKANPTRVPEVKVTLREALKL
jgi:hypothetical protein